MSRISTAQVVYFTSLIFLSPFVVYRGLESSTIFNPETKIRWGLWITVTMSVVSDFFYVLCGLVGCLTKNSTLLSCNLRMIPLNVIFSLACVVCGIILEDTMIPLFGVNIVLLIVSGIILLYLNSLLDPSCFDLNLGI